VTTRRDGKLRADYVTDAERSWFPTLDAVGLGGLVDELVRQGQRGARAAGIAWFVSSHRDGRPDRLNSVTRANYRTTLRTLELPSPDGYDRHAIPG
jgi:hypothetical protein